MPLRAQESGRIALVTGGATRVGRAIVERLSREGYAVLFTYHSNKTDAEEMVEKRGAENVRSVWADFTEPAAAVASIQAALSGFANRLDVLVNNASVYQPADPRAVTLEQSRSLMAVHYESPLLLVQAFAETLRRSEGHVVNMLDLMAEKPSPKYMSYCASKAALWNLTLSLARELAPEVTVNGIAPGVVDWPADMHDEERQKYLRKVPLGRAGTPEDVAGLVHYLCTEGNYVTGQIIRLDGGRSIMA